MGQEMRFDRSALYDEDFATCTCGFLQFLGFRCRISKAIDPGSYARLHSSDSEVDVSDDSTNLQIKEKDQVPKQPNSFRRNIKAWIKRRINRRRQNKNQNLCSSSGSNTTQLIRTNAIYRSKYTQTTGGSIKELGRTLLDGILHRIPYGQKVPEEMIKEKLSRSLSAERNYNYDACNKRDYNNKVRRVYSSPPRVSERKIHDMINGNVKRDDYQETLSNGFSERYYECDVKESVNGGDEEVVLTGESAESTACEIFSELKEDDAIGNGLARNLEFEKEENGEILKPEKIENGGTTPEISDAGPMESAAILHSKIGETDDLCIDSKELECLMNLLKQLGFESFDTSFKTNEETTQFNTEEEEEDDNDFNETPISDSEVTLQEFKKAWDQINKIEFAKFDCNLIPHDLILVLDLIDQAYEESYANCSCSSSFVWFPNYVSRLNPKTVQNHVLKEVQERVTWYLKANEECSDEADDLIAWDYERYDEWSDDRRADLEGIVVELERLVLDDLVEGLVIGEDFEVQR